MKPLYVIFVLLVAIIPLFNSILNFILAQKYAELIHKNISEIFNGGIHGFSPYKTYSGVYCLAIDKLGNSIADFFTTFMILGIIVFVIIIEEKNLKIKNLGGETLLLSEKFRMKVKRKDILLTFALFIIPFLGALGCRFFKTVKMFFVGGLITILINTVIYLYITFKDKKMFEKWAGSKFALIALMLWCSIFSSILLYSIFAYFLNYLV